MYYIGMYFKNQSPLFGIIEYFMAMPYLSSEFTPTSFCIQYIAQYIQILTYSVYNLIIKNA